MFLKADPYLGRKPITMGQWTTETNCWDVWHGSDFLPKTPRFELELWQPNTSGVGELSLLWYFLPIFLKPWKYIPDMRTFRSTWIKRDGIFLEGPTETQVPKVFTQDGARYLRYVCSFQKKNCEKLTCHLKRDHVKKDNCLLTTIFQRIC